MATTIFPTQADVGPNAGDGRILTEENLSVFLDTVGARNGQIISGLTPSNGGGLVVNVAAGSALISGYLVVIDAQITHTMPDSSTRGLWLQLTRDGNNRVTGASLVDSASSVPGDLSDALFLAYVRTAGGAFLEISDERGGGSAGHDAGVYVGDGAGARTISLPRTPSQVWVFGTDNNSRFVACSALQPPGFRGFDVAVFPRPGWRIHDGAEYGTPATFGTPGVLKANQTWDPSSVSPGGSTTVDVTVTGARVGNLVACSHASIPTFGTGEEKLSGEVVADDTVRVTFSVDGAASGNRDPASATLFVQVFRHDDNTLEIPAQDVVYTTDTTGNVIPFVELNGFRVGGGDPGDLNRSGTQYRFLAFY